MSEDNSQKPPQQKDIGQVDLWKIFSDRLDKAYPTDVKIAKYLVDIINNIWKETSPSIGKRDEVSFAMNEFGKITGSPSSWTFMIGISILMRQMMNQNNQKNTTSKQFKTLEKKFLQRLDKRISENMGKIVPMEPIRCSSCHMDNNKFSKYCSNCGKKI